MIEELLDIGRLLLNEKRIVVVQGHLCEQRLQYLKLAVEFASMPAGFQFRALCEQWTRDRLCREMHS